MLCGWFVCGVLHGRFMLGGLVCGCGRETDCVTVVCVVCSWELGGGGSDWRRPSICLHSSIRSNQSSSRVHVCVHCVSFALKLIHTSTSIYIHVHIYIYICIYIYIQGSSLTLGKTPPVHFIRHGWQVSVVQFVCLIGLFRLIPPPSPPTKTKKKTTTAQTHTQRTERPRSSRHPPGTGRAGARTPRLPTHHTNCHNHQQQIRSSNKL